jgi:DGQHR domain-containing protein
MKTKQADFIEVKCFKLIQPIGVFYIGVISWDDLNKISYTDQRRIEKGETGMENHFGIQRRLSPKRVKEIRQYVNFIDATFPTSVILSINSYDYQNDEPNIILTKKKYNEFTVPVLKIKNKKDIAQIIDGQHRIAGLKGLNKEKKFDLNVTIFLDMDIENQAMVFATINKAQTKVNKSLVYDLYDFAEHKSPQKTCHNIAKLLNEKDDSPFKDKIKMLGKAEDPLETITQSTFVENLLKYITKNPKVDRDILKRGKKIKLLEDIELEKRPFQNMFEKKEDGKIAKIIFNYFKAVEQKWPKAWNKVDKGNILNRSTGFIALMRFLRDSYNHFNKKNEVISQEDFFTVFKKIDLASKDFIPDNYKPGSSGQSKLYNDFKQFLNNKT